MAVGVEAVTTDGDGHLRLGPVLNRTLYQKKTGSAADRGAAPPEGGYLISVTLRVLRLEL